MSYMYFLWSICILFKYLNFGAQKSISAVKIQIVGIFATQNATSQRCPKTVKQKYTSHFSCWELELSSCRGNMVAKFHTVNSASKRPSPFLQPGKLLLWCTLGQKYFFMSKNSNSFFKRRILFDLIYFLQKVNFLLGIVLEGICSFFSGHVGFLI